MTISGRLSRGLALTVPRPIETRAHEPNRPGITLVTLNRPERLNAMTAELVGELHDALGEIDQTGPAGWSSSPEPAAGSAPAST
jgi:hypothetical protein